MHTPEKKDAARDRYRPLCSSNLRKSIVYTRPAPPPRCHGDGAGGVSASIRLRVRGGCRRHQHVAKTTERYKNKKLMDDNKTATSSVVHHNQKLSYLESSRQVAGVGYIPVGGTVGGYKLGELVTIVTCLFNLQQAFGVLGVCTCIFGAGCSCLLSYALADTS